MLVFQIDTVSEPSVQKLLMSTSSGRHQTMFLKNNYSCSVGLEAFLVFEKDKTWIEKKIYKNSRVATKDEMQMHTYSILKKLPWGRGVPG